MSNDSPIGSGQILAHIDLVRLSYLANQYNQAHNYMIDKKSYSQQNVDYTFSLGERQKSYDIEGYMFTNNVSSADIYKSLILQKIFGGIGKRYQDVTLDQEFPLGNQDKQDE